MLEEDPGISAGGAFDEDEAFIVKEEGGDDLGELPPLELEDSQELKRFLFPEEVVRALDYENEAALAAIRDEWQKLVQETEDRNRKKLEILAK